MKAKHLNVSNTSGVLRVWERKFILYVFRAVSIYRNPKPHLNFTVGPDTKSVKLITVLSVRDSFGQHLAKKLYGVL